MTEERLLQVREFIKTIRKIAIEKDATWEEDMLMMAEFCDSSPSPIYLKEQIAVLQKENEAMKAAINTPVTHDFLTAVQMEAAHQKLKWGSSSDAGKTDADWFWLIGYLAGKALMNPGAEAIPRTSLERGKHPEIDLFLKSLDEKAKKNLDKQLHRIITVAAAACNWHAAKLGLTDMRPGTDQKEGV